MNAGRTPDIVCIGAQKAGTSWLHETLSSRPDIWVPPFKELHFFDHKFITECRRWAPWHVRKGLNAARERHMSRKAAPDAAYLEYLDMLARPPLLNAIWYRFVFSRAGTDQKCLDVTPEYCCIPEIGVDFFKRFLPEAKLIFIIRDPVDRLRSQLRMMAHRKSQAALSDGEWRALLDMSAVATRGDYAAHVPRWDERFSEDQLLYLPFGQIRTNPLSVLREIEKHCGLPAEHYTDVARKVHQTAPVPMPDFVVDTLQSRAASQNQFLKDRFGQAFLDNTR